MDFQQDIKPSTLKLKSVVDLATHENAHVSERIQNWIEWTISDRAQSLGVVSSKLALPESTEGWVFASETSQVVFAIVPENGQDRIKVDCGAATPEEIVFAIDDFQAVLQSAMRKKSARHGR